MSCTGAGRYSDETARDNTTRQSVEQLDLLTVLAVDVDAIRHPGDVERRWLAYHGEHPYVARSMVRHARAWLAVHPDGYVSANLLINMVRCDGSAPPMTNDFAPFYARWIVSRHPDLAGVFELRPSRADRAVLL